MRGTQVYVENRTHVQLPATQERPTGGVLTLEQGWNDIGDDESLLEHPVIGRLKQRSSEAQKRQNERAKMSREVAQGKVSGFEEQRMAVEHYHADIEDQQAAIEEWNERAQQAADDGIAFTEPHPDKNVQQARSLTAPTHVFSAAGLAQKPTSTKEAKEYRESLPSESESNRRSRDRREEDESKPAEHHARRVTPEDEEEKKSARTHRAVRTKDE